MDKVWTLTDQTLAELVDAHAGRARLVALRVLRDPHLADDAVQEAFLDLWRQSGRFDQDRASISTWICVLAHRRAVDLARREARRRLGDEQAGPVDPDSYTAEELVVLREEQRQVRAAVGELTPPLRQVVELAFFGGLTHREVAERLRVPLGTVKSRMFEALRRLDVALA
jgi:RNA polymerase sigma-70 factor (ECF subfamily)